MTGEKIKKQKADGTNVEVLGATYDEGEPEGPERWRSKMRDRKEMLAYLKSAERYWFSDDAYGSERRKTKA